MFQQRQSAYGALETKPSLRYSFGASRRTKARGIVGLCAATGSFCAKQSSTLKFARYGEMQGVSDEKSGTDAPAQSFAARCIALKQRWGWLLRSLGHVEAHIQYMKCALFRPCALRCGAWRGTPQLEWRQGQEIMSQRSLHSHAETTGVSDILTSLEASGAGRILSHLRASDVASPLLHQERHRPAGRVGGTNQRRAYYCQALCP